MSTNVSGTTPSLGTAFSDGVRIGDFRFGNVGGGAPGIPLSPVNFYFINPTPIPNGVVVANHTAVTGVPLTLLDYTGGVPGPYSNPQFMTFQGYQNVLRLDTCRGLIINTSASGPLTNITVVISGWDQWGNKMVYRSPSITSDTATNVAKSFGYIKSIYVLGFVDGVDVEVTVADVFGLPYFVYPSPFAPTAASSVFAFSDGNAVPATILSGITTASTASSGDVRGTFSPTTPVAAGYCYTIVNYVIAADCAYGTNIQFALDPAGIPPTQAKIYGLPQFADLWDQGV